ncbi:hypothetical protein BGP77_11525 [Saccharospirillum sp. MSK14-1]|uniref:helix-turn-helix transcriptional regulator n=1 Tax=Saccharospirillum sp. MSK14-1 TaxID=1897632 RepID=UPI000D3960C7|nr:hypothetical protein [Saccharospirillum sp. MSK14-1]PTY38570.1 hypothetical protein BGP77_11525 [Saccharospirillum sp. MSK14-1]
MSNMLYTLVINQVKAFEWELNLPQAAIFAVVYDAMSWANTVSLDGGVWYHLSKSKICSELPIATDKPDTAWRHLKSLEKKDLIEVTSLGKRTLVRLTEKGQEWNRSKLPATEGKSTTRKNIRPTENNPSNGDKSNDGINIPNAENNSLDVGKISDPTSEKFPTDDYTSNTNYQDESKTLCATDSDEPETRNSKFESDIDQTSIQETNNPYPKEYITAKGRKLHGENLLNFDEFWETFNYKKDRARAADAWLNISWTPKGKLFAAELNRELFLQIIVGAAIERAQRDLKVQTGQCPIYPEAWLSRRRWEDEDPDLAAQHEALRNECLSVTDLNPQTNRERIRAKLRDVMSTDW